MSPGLSLFKNQLENGSGRREASVIHGLDGIIVLAHLTDNIEMSYWLHSPFFALLILWVSTLAAPLSWWSPSLSPMPSFTLDLAEITTYKPPLFFEHLENSEAFWCPAGP